MIPDGTESCIHLLILLLRITQSLQETAQYSTLTGILKLYFLG